MAACSLHTVPVIAATTGPSLVNGVGLHGPLTWGVKNADGTGYAWPVYQGEKYQMPTDLLRKVKESGFDFVRLTVDPGPLLAFQGKQLAELDKLIVQDVREIRGTGLDVLVDFHPISMVKAYAADRLESEGEDGLFGRYIEMIRHYANLLSSIDPGHVAIEPMNEPQHGYDSESRRRWQIMMKQLYEAVHAGSPDMTVVVTGGRGGNIDGLLDLDPSEFRDGDVRFSFHYYLPYVFTHQGVVNSNKNSRTWAYTVGLPYPVKPSEFDAFWIVFERNVADAGIDLQDKDRVLEVGRKQLGDYFQGGGTRAQIGRDFDKVTEWANRYHITQTKIIMGEFGATQRGPRNPGANPDDRARYLSDVRQEAETRGFHWSLWALNGKSNLGMSLVSVDDENTIDAKTASALGKRAP